MTVLRSRTSPRIRHLRRVTWSDKATAFHHLQATTLTEARAAIRRLLLAVSDVKAVINWVSGIEQDLQEARAAIPFVDVCRENHLDPDTTARKLFKDVPPELIRLVER